MRATVDLDDIRIVVAKLSDENKKYVIAVAQALLSTQKETKTEQDKSGDKVCIIDR